MQWKSYRYELTEEGAVITQYAPEEEEVSVRIPDRIDGHPVVAIGEEAFSENGSLLERAEVPSSVKRIGNGAFKMCMSLTDLALQEGLEQIGEEAFYLTPLEELYLPGTVRELGRSWELGGIRFRISTENPWFSTDGYGLYRKTEENGQEEKELLVVCQAEGRMEYSPEEGTTRIGENAMAGNASLRRVRLPDTVHTIGEAAFEGCQQLEEIVLPEGLREISAEAFSHCIRMRELHLPASLEILGRHAVSDTFGWSDSLNGLEEITVDAGNPFFMAEGGALFRKLTPETTGMEPAGRVLVKYSGHDREYRIPGDIVCILSSAFRRAQLSRVDVPRSVREVGTDAFRECKNLREIYLEESDTLLYVPGQPVYRKDEITALFCSREREERRKEVPEEEFILPEKWQSFARMPVSSGPGKEKRNPYETYVFDYRGYDALFHTYLNLPDQYGMAVCRLKYPVLLDADVRMKYEAFIREHLPEILDSIAERQDMRHLAQIAELGFFTEQNIEDCIERLNRPGCAKEMSYLLNYKREHLGETEFDFTL